MRPSLSLLLLAGLSLTVACGKDEDDTGYDPGTTDSCPPPEEDADGDCHSPPEDCDDNDPYVYPGADEVPYDGKDNDCAGDGDLTDWDGDGYDGEAVGGDDCNDGNPEIHPDAEETCQNKYDGVDADCDGSEQTDDCDGDGYDRWEDCNDDIAESYPGAEEIWYDDIDGNCDLQSDYDQDGDGDDHADYGGTDCDDTRDDVYYGAQELLDEIDHDCNGEPGRIDQADGYAEFLGSNYNDYDNYIGYRTEWISDMDGDGLDDIVACGHYWGYCAYDKESAYQCRCYLLPGAGEGDDSNFADNEFGTITGAVDEYLGWGMAVVDDLDGDGLDEILTGAPVYTISGTYGAAHLFSGADILDLGNITASDAVAHLYSAEGYSYFAFDTASLDDVDGDGLSELVATTASEYVGSLGLHVWSGGDALLGGNLSSDEALATFTASGYGGSTVGGGDFDGDGLPELITGADGYDYVLDASGKFYVMEGRAGKQYVIAGSDLAMGGTFASSSVATISGTGTEGIGWRNGWTHDIDGDGYDELLASGWYSSEGAEEAGIAYVIPGPDAMSGGSAASLASFTIKGSQEFGWGTAAERPADIDGDGRGDVVFVHLGDTINGNKGEAYLWLGEDIADGGTVSASDSPYYFVSKYQDDRFGWATSFRDFDGDGDDDIVMSAYYPSEGKVWAFESIMGD
jgi:hypothetical protein